MLVKFIDDQMGPADQMAIASASGRIGFLQQFTDNKDVLRAAVARLRSSPKGALDYGGGSDGAPMTEYNALSIERKDDPNLFVFYVQNCLLSGIRGSDSTQRRTLRDHCEIEVKNRAAVGSHTSRGNYRRHLYIARNTSANGRENGGDETRFFHFGRLSSRCRSARAHFQRPTATHNGRGPTGLRRDLLDRREGGRYGRRSMQQVRSHPTPTVDLQALRCVRSLYRRMR